MRASSLPSRRAALVTALTAGLLLTASCTTGKPPTLSTPPPSATATGPTTPAGQLAGLAAAARGRSYAAAYAWTVKGQAQRTVLVTLATDGSWTVSVPGGAAGGQADVSIAGGPGAPTYQCILGGPATSLASARITPAPGPSGSPAPSASPTPPPLAAPVCIKIAASGADVPARYDPVVEHPFTDWLAAFSNQNAPIVVGIAHSLAGSTGTCFSVEPSAVSTEPVVDAGIYCFRDDGTLTAASIRAGTLTLSGAVAQGPPTAALPAPVSTASPVPTKALKS